MKYRYCYYVVYKFTSSPGVYGTGCIEVNRSHKIKSYKDVMSIQKLIMDNSDGKLRECIISNWKLLKRKKSDNA
jgi:hypothetical protein